jgi:DNA-binding CsgD family transcriptional regulator
MATNVIDGCAGHSSEQDEQMSRTMAVVDLRPTTFAPNGSRSGDSSVEEFERALRKIEQVVRDDDRVCPFGVSRVAVAFGPDADAVAAKTLGERLARAVRLSTVADEQADGRNGSAEAPDDRRQRSPDGDRIEARTSGKSPWSTTVTVDRLLGGVALGHDRMVSNLDRSGRFGTPIGPTLRIWHRTVVRYSTGGFTTFGTRHDDASQVGSKGTVLVVSPSRVSGGPPGLSAVAASAAAERLGFEVGTAVLACDDPLVLDVRGEAIDLVVLVVERGRETTSDLATWTSSTWNIPARLAARYCAEGIGVLAVGAGAGAGALAGCMAHGATVFSDLDELQAELSHVGTATVVDESWATSGSAFRIPPPMEALMQLTASERRVLFYLTIGKSAQDIADDLVVSVTTVRSHIRSILRKLGVRSQLAAVAIANSQDLGRSQGNGSMLEMQRELEAPGVG